MRQIQIFSVLFVTALFSSVGTAAVKAELNIDFLNAQKEIEDTEHWSGELTCRWSTFDLVVDFMGYNSARSMRLVVPGVKPTMLHSQFKAVALKLDHRFSFSIVNDKGVKYVVPDQKGAGCTVTSTLLEDSPNVKFTVSCTDLKDDKGELRGANVYSTTLACARPTELLKSK